MKPSPIFSDRQSGSILALMVCFLVVLSGIGATLMVVTASRLRSVEVLQARLESSRIALAYTDQTRADGFAALASDAATVSATPFVFPTQIWDVDVAASRIVKAFPSDLLVEPRTSVTGAERDIGAPGDLTWLAACSEAITAQSLCVLSRDGFELGSKVAMSTEVEATLWRIPAPAVRFLVSSSPASLQFPISIDGEAVMIKPMASASSSSFLVLSSGSTAFDSSDSLRLTAGADVGSRIHSIYGLPPSTNPAFTLNLDSVDSYPTGAVVEVMIGGVKHLGMDLSTYAGPRAIAIVGSAVSDGFVLIGCPSAASPLADVPLSVAVDGPLILAGSNKRYVVGASTSSNVRIYSAASPSGSGWVLNTSGGAAQTDWNGHIFVSTTGLQLQVDENWSASRFTLHGSLHVLGGTVEQVGAGRNTLAELRIVPALWAVGVIKNPLTSALRHESFIACPR